MKPTDDAQKDVAKVKEILQNVAQKQQELEELKRKNHEEANARNQQLNDQMRRLYTDFINEDKARTNALLQKKQDNLKRAQQVRNDLDAFIARQDAQRLQAQNEARQVNLNSLKLNYILRWGIGFGILGLLFAATFIYSTSLILKFIYTLGSWGVFSALGAYIGKQRYDFLQKAFEAYPMENLQKLKQDSKEMDHLAKGVQAASWAGYFQNFTYACKHTKAFAAGIRIAELNEEDKLNLLNRANI